MKILRSDPRSIASSWACILFSTSGMAVVENWISPVIHLTKRNLGHSVIELGIPCIAYFF